MNEDTLNHLPLGEQGKIKRLNCTGNLRRRLLDLGFVKDTVITAVLKSVSGDPTAYRIRDSLIALREGDSKLIDIEL